VAKLVHIANLIDLVMAPLARPPGPPPDPEMEWVPGGTFRMGADGFHPEEAPVRPATVGGFWMDRHPVTNAAFTRFVEATGYVTLAERALDPADYPGIAGVLVPGSLVFQPPRYGVSLRGRFFSGWAFVQGACWRHPLGPGSALDGMGEHPVVHVAWDDAALYALWAGKEIPTEAEWEFAARGGLDGRVYAWGDERSPGGRVMAHARRGEFLDRAGGGWTRTAPVGSCPPNGYGLSDLIGNVWEWTADEWDGPPPAECSRCTFRAGTRAHAPGREASFDPRLPQLGIQRKVLKGGSYLCAPGCCVRHRPAARIPQPVDTGTTDQGFRCVVRASAGKGASR
jgi:formylglycine-generating enzyme